MPKVEAKSAWQRVRASLSDSVDGASLAVFRILFGFLVAYEIHFKFRVGKLEEIYAPSFNFKYHFFEWVVAPDKFGTYALHITLIALGLLVAAGAYYRITSWLLCVGLSYYFLCERTLYINHVYLYCLLAGIMAAVPAHNMLSVDARYGRVRRLRQGTAPRWSIWLLRFQMGVVYTFAGLAKLNPDWLQGVPLNLWLPARLGANHWALFEELPLIMSWGGAAFDLSVTPLLLWKRTRSFAFVLAGSFHMMNAMIFGIASFPWMSLALTTMFFEPNWPRFTWPALGAMKPKHKAQRLGKFGFRALVAYVAIQVLLPMRPWFYPGSASWTEEGHEFSWHMMLRSKSGLPIFYAEAADGSRETIDPLEYITKRQLVRISARPDMIHQFALFIADEFERQGRARPKVFVDVKLSFNGRAPEPLIDPKVDLAREPRHVGRVDWLMPHPSGAPVPGLSSDDSLE